MKFWTNRHPVGSALVRWRQDSQDTAPCHWCRLCGGEIFEPERLKCRWCEE